MLSGAVDLLAATPFAEAMRAEPITALDVGARGGFEPDLAPIAFAVHAHGLEPDPAAFAALKADTGPWASLTHHPLAISGSKGKQTLNVTADPAGSSLLPFDDRIAARYGVSQYRDVTETVEIETETLDGLALGRLDYLKLDVEGAELEILAAAPGTLKTLSLVKVEVAFLRERLGQGLAGEVAALMDAAGFMLMDLIRPHRWRRGPGDVHPRSGPGPVPYDRGRLIQGDYLFLRDPDTVTDPAARRRLAWLAMSHGWFDEAKAALDGAGLDLDVERAVGQASRLYGRKARAEAMTGAAKTALRLLRDTVTGR